MTGARRELNTSASERSRIEALRGLVARGESGLGELLAMRTDPSWAVRREVIGALAELGEPALAPLCASLVHDRDDETRIAATVDTLVASTGDAEARVSALLTDDATSALLADIAQILGRRRNPASLPILAELSRATNDNVAVAAIEGLGRVGGRAVVDVLVQAVESKSFFRTFAAIDVLGKSGDPRAVAPLAALLDSPQYSLEAARALGRSGDRAAVAPLCALLAASGEGPVRVAALALADLRQRHRERFGSTASIEGAMRRSAPRSATRRLVQCSSGADAAELVAISLVLGCLGDDAAVPTLINALDGAEPVASAAAEALDRISSGSRDQLVTALWEGSSARRQVLLPTIKRSHSADAVIACLIDDDAGVRRLACDALARLGSQRAVPDLFQVLADPSQAVVQAATSAIVSLGHAATPALAVAAANSPVASVRRAGLRILSYVGPEAALRVLEAATRDPDERTRDAAIAGLALLESPEALPILLELAVATTPQTRAVALRALGAAGSSDPRVAERLGSALRDPDAWARYYACQSIGKLRLEPLGAEVGRLVTDAAGQVRVAAIEALSHLQGEAAFAALVAAAASDELDLTRAALIGLGLTGRREASGLLLPNADSSDAATRLITLSALSNLEGPEVLPALARGVRDPDESVRTAAIGFIGRRSGAEATGLLAELLKYPELQDRALEALSSPREHRVPGLASALQTADDELALQLTGLLARLDQPEATSALFEALTFENAAARRAAATTLGGLGSQEALALLRRLAVEDPDAQMRQVCAVLSSQ